MATVVDRTEQAIQGRQQQEEEEKQSVSSCLHASAASLLIAQDDDESSSAVNHRLHHILQRASYLGPSFDLDTLYDILQIQATTASSNNSDEPQDEHLTLDGLVALLDVAVMQGLLANDVGSKEYSFTKQIPNHTDAESSEDDHNNDVKELRLCIGQYLSDRIDARRRRRRQQQQQQQQQQQNDDDDFLTDWLYHAAADNWNAAQDLAYAGRTVLPLLTLNLHVGHCYKKSVETPRNNDTNNSNTLDCAVAHYQLALEALNHPSMASPWTEYYPMALQLYQSYAETELWRGHYDKGHELAQVVLQNATCIHDKVPTHAALEAALARQERYQEALVCDWQVLEKLGETGLQQSDATMQRRPSSLRLTSMTTGSSSTGNHQVKQYLKKYSDSDILALPEMTDPTHLATMQFLAKTVQRIHQLYGSSSSSSNHTTHLNVAVTRQVVLVFQHGLSVHAALAFAQYGQWIVQKVENNLQQSIGSDLRTASRMADLARHVLDQRKHDSAALRCQTLLTIALDIDPWWISLRDVANTVQVAINAVVVEGQNQQQSHSLTRERQHPDVVEGASAAWLQSHVVNLLLGQSLTQIQDELGRPPEEWISNQMISSQRCRQQLQQMVQRLTEPRRPSNKHNPADNPPHPFDEHEEEEKDEWNAFTPIEHPTASEAMANFVHMQVAFYLGEWKVAEKIAQQPSILPSVCLSQAIFVAGLAAMRLAIECPNKKQIQSYKTKDRTAVAKLKKLAKYNAIDNAPKFLLLQATFAATFGKVKRTKLKEQFDQAIQLARKYGFIQDEALGNELAGDFFFAYHDDTFWARHYYTQAWGLYHEWGAQAKVVQLVKRRGAFIRKADFQGSMSSITVRTRKDDTTSLVEESDMGMMLCLDNDNSHTLQSPAAAGDDDQQNQDEHFSFLTDDCEMKRGSDSSAVVAENSDSTDQISIRTGG